MMGELIMRCFHARTNAHVLHLKTTSFAKHKALNEFYDEVPDLADKLAEAYQGDYGLIESYPARYIPIEDPVALVDGLAEWIAKNRYDCCDGDDTYLQNIIDEIMALCRSTTYKLKVLKVLK